jgi:hypothetical protein
MRSFKSPRRLKLIAKQIAQTSNSLVRPLIPASNKDNRTMNCWGFVAQAAGWIKQEEWLTQKAMQDLLFKYTRNIPTKQVTAGDILAYWDDRGLIHTAIVIDQTGLILHKPGWQAIETAQAEEVYQPSKIQARRIIQGGV